MAKTKICVTAATKGSQTIEGVFTWKGRNWHTAQLIDCVWMPLRGYTQKDLIQAYNTIRSQIAANGGVL